MVVSTSAVDCLERLVSEMTYYVSSGMLNHTYSLTVVISGDYDNWIMVITVVIVLRIVN